MSDEHVNPPTPEDGSLDVPSGFGERLTLDDLATWLTDDNVALSKAARDAVEDMTEQADVKVKLLLLGILRQKVGHISKIWTAMDRVRNKLFSEETIRDAETMELVQIYRTLRDDLALTEESMQANAAEATKVTIDQLHVVFDTGNKTEISKLPVKARERLRAIFSKAVAHEVEQLAAPDDETVVDADFEVTEEDEGEDA
jgi:hypothetical protein